jgi:hypothetical protein
MFCGTWIILAFARMAGLESLRSGSNERAGFFFLICVSLKKKWLIVLCVQFVCPVIL